MKKREVTRFGLAVARLTVILSAIGWAILPKYVLCEWHQTCHEDYDERAEATKAIYASDQSIGKGKLMPLWGRFLLATAGIALLGFAGIYGLHKPIMSSTPDTATGRTAYLAIPAGRFQRGFSGYVTTFESTTYPLAEDALPVGIILIVFAVAKYPMEKR